MTEAPSVRELDITLDRNSPIPLYYQVAQSIEHAINTGALAPGDRLENELSLTSRLGLSRPTARQAIQELVKKGLLQRKRTRRDARMYAVRLTPKGQAALSAIKPAAAATSETDRRDNTRSFHALSAESASMHARVAPASNSQKRFQGA